MSSSSYEETVEALTAVLKGKYNEAEAALDFGELEEHLAKWLVENGYMIVRTDADGS